MKQISPSKYCVLISKCNLYNSTNKTAYWPGTFKKTFDEEKTNFGIVNGQWICAEMELTKFEF